MSASGSTNRTANANELAPKTFAQGLFDTSSTQLHPLGTKRMLNDGREFVYCQAGSSQLAAGVLCQGAGIVANDTDVAVTVQSSAIGDAIIYATLGGATTANLYAEGYLVIEEGTGLAYAYKIKSHPAGTTNVAFTLYEKLRVAFNTSDTKVTFVKNPCKATVIHPSPPTTWLVGVTPCVVTASYYYWSQVKGPCIALIDTTVVVGKMVAPSVNVDGAMMPPTLTEGTPNTGFDQQICGSVIFIAANTKYGLVNLNIPGY